LRVKPDVALNLRQPVRVAVVAPRLTALSVSRDGSIELQPHETPKMELSVEGLGTLRVNQLVTQSLAAAISGSGDAQGSGQAAGLSVSIAGSGDVKVKIAGSGDARVQAQRTLAVSIAGSGDVRYSGEPAVTRTIAGSGNVARR
jgi:hypothetical protein